MAMEVQTQTSLNRSSSTADDSPQNSLHSCRQYSFSECPSSPSRLLSDYNDNIYPREAFTQTDRTCITKTTNQDEVGCRGDVGCYQRSQNPNRRPDSPYHNGDCSCPKQSNIPVPVADVNGPPCKKISRQKESEKEATTLRPRLGFSATLREIKENKLPANTPILTDIFLEKNKFRIIIPNITELQKFAEAMKGNKTFELLKTRPIRLELGRGVNKLTSDKTVESGRCEQTETIIEADIVFKIFLNGVSHATDQFVSVCLSIVPRNDKQCTEQLDKNVLEKWLVASVYLKGPNRDDKPYRKDFKMKFFSQLEEGDKGLMKFIEKREFTNYLADDSVTVGVAIRLESFA